MYLRRVRRADSEIQKRIRNTLQGGVENFGFWRCLWSLSLFLGSRFRGEDTIFLNGIFVISSLASFLICKKNIYFCKKNIIKYKIGLNPKLKRIIRSYLFQAKYSSKIHFFDPLM